MNSKWMFPDITCMLMILLDPQKRCLYLRHRSAMMLFSVSCQGGSHHSRTFVSIRLTAAFDQRGKSHPSRLDEQQRTEQM